MTGGSGCASPPTPSSDAATPPRQAPCRSTPATPCADQRRTGTPAAPARGPKHHEAPNGRVAATSDRLLAAQAPARHAMPAAAPGYRSRSRATCRPAETRAAGPRPCAGASTAVCRRRRAWGLLRQGPMCLRHIVVYQIVRTAASAAASHICAELRDLRSPGGVSPCLHRTPSVPCVLAASTTAADSQYCDISAVLD